MICCEQIIKEFSGFSNLKDYLANISKREFQTKVINKDTLGQPIIFRWIKKRSMQKSLSVIDRKAGKLLRLNQKGKLKNWLLGDDQQFNSMTAERYIADYLEKKLDKDNLYKFVDNPQTQGVDGFITEKSKSIGIEITTLNGLLTVWMFTERLTQLLELGNLDLLRKGTLEVFYSGKKLMTFRISNDLVQEMQKYIKKVFENIKTNQRKEKWYSKHLSTGFEIDKNGSQGYIVWEQNDKNDSKLTKQFLNDLTEGVIRKIASKSNQLSRQSANIVFVGVNHTSGLNWLNPGIFEELGNCSNAVSYVDQIRMLENFYACNLPGNILGVIFFVYSLHKEKPFYPLFMLRNGQLEHKQYEKLYALLF